MARQFKEGLTFDDILLIPEYSDVVPAQVDISTRLTDDITLNIPLLSASMDTVTECELAIALAREGGLGMIHKNMSIEAQAQQVDKVKRSENGVITHPFHLTPEHKLSDALDLMRKFKISGVPITRGEKLVGIITNRDLRFETDYDKLIGDVMTKDNLITAPVGTTLEEAQKILGEHRIEKLPLVDKEGNLKGLITIKDIEKAIKYPHSAKDKSGRLLAGAAVGVTGDIVERVSALVNSRVDVVTIDTAHGQSKNVLTCVSMIKSKFPNLPLIVGNVATAEGTKALFENGADIIIGGHPHVPEPMELRRVTDEDGKERTCFLVYSLGNLISGQNRAYTDLTAEKPSPRTSNFSIETGGNSYIDNEEILFALRGVTYDSAKSFQVYNASVDRVQTVRATPSESDSDSFDFSIGGEEGAHSITYYPVSIGIAEEQSGGTQTAWYAGTTDTRRNTYRNVMLRLETPLAYSLGTLVYELQSAEFTDTSIS